MLIIEREEEKFDFAGKIRLDRKLEAERVLEEYKRQVELIKAKRAAAEAAKLLAA
jgi:hypothetical protein